ncbi:MAG: DUF1553 domain-containing protein [Acidimicrobiia bacterium]|nr:DUF1553 domain-containing protein [Acidimicrobiia bacterium]
MYRARAKSLAPTLVMTIIRGILSFVVLAFCLGPLALGGDLSFESDIRPIFDRQCVSCHNAQSHQSGLDLESEASVFKGGSLDGPAVIAGKSEASPLILRLRGHRAPRMPLSGEPVPAEKIALIARWIDQLKVEPHRSSAVKHRSWPWTPLTEPQVPPVKAKDWIRNPIDAFVLAKLEAKGLEPAPVASHRALLRRIYFGLIGLPPTPEDTKRFLGDTAPDAYAREIDRLLANPAYGERWGRHWLDLVRYADTLGEAIDYPRPHLWRYRDYVVRAFNQDMPYDRFIRQQIAGDTYGTYGAEGKIATGFLHQWVYVQRTEAGATRRDFLNDVVGTTGAVFQGLTLGCARCHDHKYDPIPTRDYYRFEAFFSGLKAGPSGLPFTQYELPMQQPELWQAKAQAWEQLLAGWQKRADQLKAGLKERAEKHLALMAPQDLKDWVVDDLRRTPFPRENLYSEDERKQLKLFGKQTARFGNPNSPDYYKPTAYVASEGFGETDPAPPTTYVLKGGNFTLRGDPVEPGFFSAVTGNSNPASLEGLDIRSSGGSPRKVLAEWMASRDNPLTARVMVNRIWQYHFGEGLVATPSDFGKNGAGTLHPELIDWLAWQFVESGWSVKTMHRLILQSNVYRQSMRNAHQDAYEKADSDVRYLWRRKPIRLESEVIRDSMLAVSGKLQNTLGGPPFFPEVEEALLQQAGTWWQPSPPEEQNRRSLYLLQCRSLQEPMISVFDGPNINESCPVRTVSTVAPQVFALFNSRFSHAQSRALAKRIEEGVGQDVEKQVDQAFQFVFQRAPSALEKTQCVAFLRQSKPAAKELTFASLKPSVLDAGAGFPRTPDHGKLVGTLVDLCLVLMNLNEFVFLE